MLRVSVYLDLLFSGRSSKANTVTLEPVEALLGSEESWWWQYFGPRWFEIDTNAVQLQHLVVSRFLAAERADGGNET
jgi:hypothetical protein